MTLIRSPAQNTAVELITVCLHRLLHCVYASIAQRALTCCLVKENKKVKYTNAWTVFRHIGHRRVSYQSMSTYYLQTKRLFEYISHELDSYKYKERIAQK